jgi:hypothetical protein
MSNEAIKYQVLVALHEGADPKVIAEELDISYSKVIKYRSELRAATAEGRLNSLLHLPDAAVELMAEKLVKDLPEELQPMAEENLAKLSKGVAGLERLDTELLQTASHMNNRIRTMVSTIEHVSELTELTKALCEIRNAFFNKSGVQLNIQNNVGGEASAYTEFLTDTPGGA